jgi:acetoin utilization deacetylase AcuC-like enzyme
MQLFFISHPACAQHRAPSAHPECPERLAAIDDQLMSSGIEPFLLHREAPPVTREQLLRVHSPDYLDTLMGLDVRDGQWTHLDGGDTYFGAGSLEAAYRAAGAGVLAVDLVLGAQSHKAFCSVRPPGHHAGRDYAMGFCVFNNVAIAAAHALATSALERVAIVDFDVHHGNGTEDIFRGDPRVLFCSTFQHPFYPHSGADSETANVVNVPLPRDTQGARFRTAVEEQVLPALETFKPQLLLISAGFDGHLEDEMANFRLVEADYAWVTRALVEVADRHADGRVVSMLEGGYALSALARSVVAHLRALAE